jgi:two-component system, OmpR family, sensor histidine kinase KdpD
MNGMPGRRRPARAREWVLWLVGLALLTALLVPVRTRLNEAHIALAFLLLVQFASARGGRALGFTLAAVAFVCFNFFLLPPYYTLHLQNPVDWLVLAAFLVTSLVSAQLLYRAQAEAEKARQRAQEVDRLAALGAETLSAGRADAALASIAGIIRATLNFDACVVYTIDQVSGQPAVAAQAAAPGTVMPDDMARDALLLATWTGEHGRAAAQRLDGTSTLGTPGPGRPDEIADLAQVRLLFRPLRVRDRTVGVLALRRDAGLALSAEQHRVLDALDYYAALALERVRLVAEADRAEVLGENNRAKDALLASVSHDLRTPLTTIKGLAHELAEGGDDRAAVIEDEADRLGRLVGDLLDLSAISSGAVRLDLQPNEAEDLLGAAAQRVAGALGDHELRMAVAGTEQLLFGRFDFAQTLRALVNLIENAAKYSPAGMPIELTAQREDEWLRFDVADRGPGVDSTDRERVFEAFYRRSVGGAVPAGAGLGLSIARSLVAAQGGSITYRDREGGGSVFSIRVPAIDTTNFDLPA